MPLYIAVVQLENAVENDYQKLHEALQSRSFKTATYAEQKKEESMHSLIATKTGNMPGVIDAVKNAASETGKIFSFTVMRNKR